MLTRLRGMSQRDIALALLAVLLAYLVFVHLPAMGGQSFLWFAKPQPSELYLTSYDTHVGPNETLNFSVHVPGRYSCQFCGMPVAAPGDGVLGVSTPSDRCAGFVNFSCGPLSVGFSYATNGSGRPEYAQFVPFKPSVDGRDIVLDIVGEGHTNGYSPLIVSLDGVEVLSAMHRVDGYFAFHERVPASPGAHRVEVSFLTAHAQATVQVERPYPYSSLLVLLLCVALALMVGRGIGARVMVFLTALLASLAFEFQLSALGVSGLGVLGLAALLYLAKSHKYTWSINSKIGRDALLFGLLWVLLIAGIAVAMGNFDVWGPYYYRQAEQTLARGTPFYTDTLSYLGRPSTYPAAFFDFAAALSGTIAAPSFESVRVPIHLLLAFALAFGVHMLFSTFGRLQRWVASLSFLGMWFLFMVSTVHTLHVYAYALLVLGVVVLHAMPNPYRWLAIVPLAAGFGAHPTVLVFFPFFSWVARRFEWDFDWLVRLVVAGVGSAVLSLAFYLPVFLRSGLPNEVAPSQWGYLLTYGFDGVRFEFQLLLPFILIAALYGLYANRQRLASLAVLVSLAIDLFVSFRINVVLAALGAALVPLVLLEERKPARSIAAVLLLAGLGSLALGLVLHAGVTDHCSWGLANPTCVQPFDYISRYTSTNESMAVPPLMGHLATWRAARPVLADPYVEYASEEKFKANSEFYQTGAAAPLAKYNIDIAVQDKAGWPLRPRYNGTVQGATAKLYDNGYESVYRLR